MDYDLETIIEFLESLDWNNILVAIFALILRLIPSRNTKLKKGIKELKEIVKKNIEKE